MIFYPYTVYGTENLMQSFLELFSRYGFEALAFACMFWLCARTIAENTKAIQKLDRSIIQLCIKILTHDLQTEREQILDKCNSQDSARTPE